MRFVTYLACTTLVARASHEEDDDLLMIRGLQSNSSNATTTTAAPSSSNATTTTAAPSSSNATTTTAAPSSSNATTTTAAPSSSNATTTTAAPTTTAAATGETTAAATGDGSAEQTTTAGASGGSTADGTKKVGPTAAEEEAAAAEMKAMSDFQAANNGTDLAEAIEVSVVAATEAKDPFHCWMETTESEACTKEKADAAAAASSSNSTRRTLAATKAMKDAHNIFCGAFSFASSYSVCDALGESSLKTFFQGATKAAAMDNCATGLSGAYLHPDTSNGQCSDDTGDGVCFVNELYSQNTATKLTAAETHACTRAVGTSSTKEFKTKTSMKLPKWKATKESVTIDATTIESTAKTNVAANSELLQTALVVSAVAIHKDPALSAVLSQVPVKSSLGLTDAAFDKVVTAIGTGDINVSASTISSPSGAGGALGDALDEAKTLVKAQYTVEDKSGGGGGGGSTSGTTAVMAMSSVAIGFFGLVF